MSAFPLVRKMQRVSQSEILELEKVERDILVRIDALPSSFPRLIKSWLRCKTWSVVKSSSEAASQMAFISDLVNRAASKEKFLILKSSGKVTAHLIGKGSS